MSTTTKTKRFTKAEVIAAMKRAVDARGADYTYPSDDDGCHYRWDARDEAAGYGRQGDPACIVGVVFADLGVLDELVPPVFDGLTVDMLSEDDLASHFTSAAFAALYDAQRVQDSLNPWGKALAAAREGRA